MGALSDYYAQLESGAQAAKSSMWDRISNGYVDMETYLQDAKRNFYGNPTEDQLRRERQREKDAYIQASQQRLDAQNPAISSSPGLYEKLKSDWRDAANFDYTGREDVAPQYTLDAYGVASPIQPAPAQQAPQQQAAEQQGPALPAVPEGWNQSGQAPEQLSPETMAALTPEERIAQSQGFVPAKVEVVHPAITGAIEEASKRIAPTTERSKKRLETTPVVDAAFEEMLKSVPAKFRPLSRMIKNENIQRQEQQRAEIAQAGQSIEQYRRAKHASIETGFSKLPPEAFQYGAVNYELNQQKALADRNAAMDAAQLSVYGMEPTAASERLKILRDQIDSQYKDSTKPFEETDQYKRAMNAKDSLQKDIQKQNNFTGALKVMQEMLASGKINEATEFGRATVAQMQNSLINDNALQTTEMLIRYYGLLSPDLLNQLQSKSPFNLNNLVYGSLTNSEKSKQIEELSKDKGFIKTLVESAYKSNPQKFLQAAVTTHNVNADALNSAIRDRVIKPTSHKIANIAELPKLPQFESINDLVDKYYKNN